MDLKRTSTSPDANCSFAPRAALAILHKLLSPTHQLCVGSAGNADMAPHLILRRRRTRSTHRSWRYLWQCGFKGIYAAPGMRVRSSLRFRLICATASASVTDHKTANSAAATRASAGVKGRFPMRANGPSVSVNTRSRGICAASPLPFSLRSMAGPTENQQSRAIADFSSLLEPENQCKTAVGPHRCF